MDQNYIRNLRLSLSPASQRNLDSLKLFALFFLLFTIFSHTIGDNENSRIDTTISIVENNQLNINNLHNNTGDKAYIDGNYYSEKPPMPSLLAIPSYVLVDLYFGGSLTDNFYLDGFRRSLTPKMEWARFAATVSVSATAGAGVISLIYLILIQIGVGRSYALVSASISGIGSLIFPYSTTFHGTMSGTFFLMLAVFIWIRNDLRPPLKKTFLMAFFIGLGVSSEYLISIPGGLLLLLNCLQSPKDKLGYIYGIGGLLFGLLPLFVFHFLTTGNPLEPPLLHVIGRDLGLKSQVALGDSLILTLARAIRVLFYPLNGLLVFTPIILFGFIGLRKLYSLKRLLSVYVLSSFLVSLLFTVIYPVWEINAFYGPRYLLPASSLLIIPLALELERSGIKEKIIIFVSSVLSGIIMLGSTQPWLGPEQSMLNSFNVFLRVGVYENRVSMYLKRMLSEGLQSPIISYLTNLSSDLHVVLSPYAQYTIPLGELKNQLILYDIRLLIAFVILSGSFLIFRREFQNATNLNSYVLLLILLMVFLSGFSNTANHMHNWYDQSPSKEVNWTRGNAEIYFHSNEGKKSILRAEMSSLETKNTTLFLNGDKVYQDQIDQRGSRITEIIEIEKGMNKLKVTNSGNCSVVGRFVENNDVRCVGIGVKNYNISSPPSAGSYLKNEKRGETEIITNLEGAYSIEFDIKSRQRTNFALKLDAKTILQGYSDPSKSRVKTSFMRLEGIEKFNLLADCSDCRLKLDNIAIEKKGNLSKETFYRLESGWYSKADHEELRWSSGNSSVLLYNHGKSSQMKNITIDARSFNKKKKFIFRLNGDNLDSKIIGTKKSSYELNARLRPGENRMDILSEKDCTVIGNIIGNDDLRCVSLGLYNLSQKQNNSSYTNGYVPSG